MIYFASDYAAHADPEINEANGIVCGHNIVTPESLFSTTAEAAHPATELANPATHLFWRGDAAPATEYIQALTSGAECDYAAVARHNFGSAGIEVQLEVAPAGSLVFEPLATFFPPDDSPIVVRFKRRALDYVRFRLVQVGSIKPQAAVFYAGRALHLQRRIYVGHTPLPYGRATKLVNGMSERGGFLGRIVLGESRSTQIALQNISPIWYRLHMEPFIAAAIEAPFFYAWRPRDYPAEVGYAWLTADPRPSNQRANGMMQVTLELGGIVD